jgi:tetratricopeptide (TPR) repeat protein
MKPTQLPYLVSTLLALSAGAWMSALSHPQSAAADGSAPPGVAPARASVPLADDELAPSRRRLLDLAFTAASAMPLHPHVKDRSRSQEAVVEACLELGQLRTARAYLEEIANWRRGSASAELALHCVQRGALDAARSCLEIARKTSDDLATSLAMELEDDGIESPQDWQRDRIRVKMAQALRLNGEVERAEELESDVVESEAGRLDAVRATLATPAGFDAQIASLEALVTGASFERARHALEACVQLFHRFYDDPTRRSRAEQALRSSGAKLPPDVHVGLLREAAELALGHGDRAKALELVEAAQAVLDGTRWTAEQGIPLRSSLAGVRHGAGDPSGAERELAEAHALYESAREGIADFYRAETLRPLAEARCTLGQLPRALELYRRVVEEGATNPNARTRAEDLAATCLSMARHAVEPDAELWQRILELNAGLGPPW